MFVSEYPWYNMSTTVHKLLIHVNSPQVIASALLPIGQLSEEAQEARNKAIKKYLDVNSDILDNKYVMQHKLDRQSDSSTKITKKQSKQLSELSNLAVKNDLHFKKFVNNNKIPSEYKDPTNRIIKYFKALNSTIANVDEDIEQLNYQPQNSINVVDVPTNYAGDVNKKQQDKIKSFLDKKNIKTDVFDK